MLDLRSDVFGSVTLLECLSEWVKFARNMALKLIRLERRMTNFYGIKVRKELDANVTFFLSLTNCVAKFSLGLR